MAKEFSRTRRLGDQIQRELAGLIQRELRDPRLGMITVSGVDVARDLSHAKVYVTVLESKEETAAVLKALNSAAGYLRHLLGQRLVVRALPMLHFVFDSSIESGVRISAAIDAAIAADQHSKKD